MGLNVNIGKRYCNNFNQSIARVRMMVRMIERFCVFCMDVLNIMW